MRVYRSNALCDCNNCVKSSQLLDIRILNRSYGTQEEAECPPYGVQISVHAFHLVGIKWLSRSAEIVIYNTSLLVPMEGCI